MLTEDLARDARIVIDLLVSKIKLYDSTPRITDILVNKIKAYERLTREPEESERLQVAEYIEKLDATEREATGELQQYLAQAQDLDAQEHQLVAQMRREYHLHRRVPRFSGGSPWPLDPGRYLTQSAYADWAMDALLEEARAAGARVAGDTVDFTAHSEGAPPQDLYRAAAARIFGVRYEDVTDWQRSVAKTSAVLYQIYGIGGGENGQ